MRRTGSIEAHPVDDGEQQRKRYRRFLGACGQEEADGDADAPRQAPLHAEVGKQSEQREKGRQQFELARNPDDRLDQQRVQAEQEHRRMERHLAVVRCGGGRAVGGPAIRRPAHWPGAERERTDASSRRRRRTLSFRRRTSPGPAAGNSSANRRGPGRCSASIRRLRAARRHRGGRCGRPRRMSRGPPASRPRRSRPRLPARWSASERRARLQPQQHHAALIPAPCMGSVMRKQLPPPATGTYSSVA